MLVGNVCLFVFVAVSLATAVSSKQVSGAGSRSGWSSFAENNLGGQELEQKLPYHSVGTPAYQDSPKQAAIGEPNNRNELTGNWTNPIDNKQYSKPPSIIRLHSYSQSHERQQDVGKKTVSKTFSKFLFDHLYSLPIREHVIKTMFVQGLATGTLRSRNYVEYMMQDIVYLDNAAKAYASAAQKMQDQGNRDFALFYWNQAQKFSIYHKELLKTWRLENHDRVETGTAIEMYMGYHKALVKNDPKFLVIGMLPCSMLYPWIIQQFIGKVQKTNPYYEDWFVKNMREPEVLSSTEIFVDSQFTSQDEKLSADIFCEGMMNELNFFREAGEEKLLTFEDVCRNRI